MTAQGLKGVISAVPTPVTDTGEIDVAGFMKVAQYLLANGCDALNVLGTTGEATSFSILQRMELMSAVKTQGLPMNRLMVGTGAAAVADTITLTRHAAELGFAGALVLPPFYYKNVPDAGVFAFLKRVIGATEQTPIQIYLYNYPALSGVLYGVALVKSLITAFPNRMAGLKDSSGDLPYARAIAALSPTFGVFPSNEACLAEARTGIFAGCISATANLNSADCHKAFHDADDAALARAVAVRKAFDGKPLIPGVKAVLAERLNLPSAGRVMPPLVAASQELMSTLAQVREKRTATA